MKAFILRHKKLIYSLFAIFFWLGIWQLFAFLLDEELFLASPVTVACSLLDILGQRSLYIMLSNSSLRIVGGFLASAALGVLMASLSSASAFIKALLQPFMAMIKAAPVASFIILALIITGSDNLALLISFLVSLPIVYTNVLIGIESIEPQQFEAADIFAMTAGDRFRAIYYPEVYPFFTSACCAGLGLCWKAGVAAEVIGLTRASLGEALYNSKIFLDIPALFAYTLIIVLVSFALEKLMSLFFAKIAPRE
ncbi:MAG: ABC transporter permease subunit [Oscillospiraceae bacterium]